MKFTLHTRPADTELLQTGCDCLVIGVSEASGALDGAALAVDAASGGLLTRLCTEGELTGKAGQAVLLHAVRGVAAHRLLVVGLGKVVTAGEPDRRRYAKVARGAAKAVAGTRAESILWAINGDADTLAMVVIALREADYRFDGYRKPDDLPPPVRSIQMLARDDSATTQNRVLQAVGIANGTALARDLGNTPPNVCTPTYLAEVAIQLAQETGLEVEVFGHEQIEAIGMHSFLSVARGSVQPPRLIVLRHQGAADPGQPPVALIGKGVTFDSGGISIKPGEAMDEMKYDMCGAASVLGVMRTCAELKLPINVVGIVVACENMPAGNALKPGDVVRSLSGIQIEVLNTDAEGRLILCDALTYAQQRFAPALTIDIATLTGACVIALGHVLSGLYANDDALADGLLSAGQRIGDRAWRMPLDEDYDEQLKSRIADVANIGGRPGGSVTAACFLQRFVEGPWAHLDIAGTAWKSGAEKGGTGRPVPLLVQYLLDRTAA